MIFNSWLQFYLKNEVLCKKNYDLEYGFKSICEFCLLCYVYKLKGEVPISYISTLKEIDLSKSKDEYRNQVNYLIHFCTNSNESKEIQTFEFKGKNNLETTFLRNISKEVPDEIWYFLIIEYLKKITKKGSNQSGIYYLTHLIFYSSNFKSNDFWDKLENRIKFTFIEIVELSILECQKSKNWDLLSELYIAKLILDPSSGEVIKKNIIREDSLIKSKQGWYLSDGIDLKKLESNYDNLSEYNKYSLFHTTIVAEILNLLIERSTLQKATHNNGFK